MTLLPGHTLVAAACAVAVADVLVLIVVVAVADPQLFVAVTVYVPAVCTVIAGVTAPVFQT